jgi:carboxyl-terminal processing protease
MVLAASAGALVFAAGVAVGRGDGSVGAESSLTGNPAYETFQQTWDLIHAEWVLPEEIDEEALIYGAAAGMVDALGDEGHSRFMDPEETARFQESTEGAYTGIGVEIDFRGPLPVVVAPIDNSPAADAGVRSGDTILAIEGEETARMELQDVAERLLGEAGTDVTVQFLGKDGEAREVTLTRRKITLDPVSWRMLPDAIAQVRISEFSARTTQELKDALTAARDAGAEALVLDLRDNGGGLVTEAIGVSSQFMAEGATIFQQQGRDGEPSPIKTVGRDGLWLDKPVAVLVNGGSASAGEIVGAALADNGRATTLGETTFGTGTVLVPFEQPDGSTVLLGTALWLSADGDRFWKEGVDPEIEVELPLTASPSRPADDLDLTEPEFAALDDTQLLAAWELLAGETAATPIAE